MNYLKDKLRKQSLLIIASKSINLTKEENDLYSENCKTLMKKIEEDKWKGIPWSWIGIINSAKIYYPK